MRGSFSCLGAAPFTPQAMESSKDAAIPTRLFSNIIPNLITVLEHTQRAEGVVTPQAKQALLQAVRGVIGYP